MITSGSCSISGASNCTGFITEKQVRPDSSRYLGGVKSIYSVLDVGLYSALTVYISFDCCVNSSSAIFSSSGTALAFLLASTCFCCC